MFNRDKNWYIQYDFKVFQVFLDPNYIELIFKIADTICKEKTEEIQRQSGNYRSQTKDVSIPKWITEIAQALTQIVTLLQNFFIVQEKLNKQQKVHKQFHLATTILKVEKQYIKLFNQRSTQFRFNRLLACCMRLNKFWDWILITSAQLKKYTDKTFQDNLEEVSLFFQQRIRETLELTKSEGENELNLILIDILSMILRKNGDPTMKPFLDDIKYKVMMDDIMKQNQISEQFQVKKAIARQFFEENRYFEYYAPEQIDPTLNKPEREDSQYSYS